MRALHEHNFPTPTPLDSNRHCVVMSLVKGLPLSQIRILPNPKEVALEMFELVVRFAHYGLVHGDFNEFNVMINIDNKKIDDCS